jgi:glycosyltransferase involved in cell wall biosynthesis
LKIFVHDYAGHPFQADLSRELAARGHETTHLYFRGDQGPKGRLERSSEDPICLNFIGVTLARAYEKTSLVRRRFDDVAYGKRIAEHILSSRPELVISGNTPTEAQSSIIAACKRTGALFVFWVQDFYSIAVTRLLQKKIGILGYLVGGYYRFLERNQFRNSDAIVVITNAFADLAKRWSGTDTKVFTIENWGAARDITPQPKNNAWAQKHHLEHSFNFLYTGTLGFKHNPELLVELAKEVVGRANVVVVSQGVGTTFLENAKRQQGIDNLVLLPLQAFSDLALVLGTSDVALATIEPDAGAFSVPSKVNAYFCAGRPVLLAAPFENLAAKTVHESGAGLVVHPADTVAFLKAAVSFLENDELRTSAGRKASEFAKANYDIKQVANRFEYVFRYATNVEKIRKEKQ